VTDSSALRTLLLSEGSVWVHCDDSEQAYLKVMMDEVFGRENFIAAIVWQKLTGRDNRTDISTTHDYILAYARSHPDWTASRNLLPYGPEQLGRFSNPDNDPRGPWMSDNLTAKAGPGRRRS
jgi:adenine-specific DNA-methyltransferase